MNHEPTVPAWSRAALAALLCTLPALAQGSLSGRVVDPLGVPIPGITVEPNHGAPLAVTDTLGLFTVTPLQSNTYDVEFRPSQGAPWVGRVETYVVSGPTAVGDVALQPGFTIAGTVLGPNSQPLPGCNINVYDQSGVKLFTPHDGTDPLGMFMVTVPAGTWDLRIVPPIGTLLVPRQFEDIVVAAPVTMGTVTIATGYQVTGSVVDSVTNVPVGNTRIKATDALTGERIVLIADTANVFGAFTLLLPYGIADLEFVPPAGNTHVGLEKFGVFVLGNTPLGPVRLQNGVLLSGTVSAQGLPVQGADIDVFASDGSRVCTPLDDTSATGTFAVAVPAGDTYTVRIEPPRSAGLVGYRSPPTAVAAATNLGAITLQPGVQVTGTISGPQGPEADANLDFLDGNGVEIVTVGDHTDANGQYTTYVPAGTYTIEVESAEGSHGKDVAVPGLAIAGPTTWNRTLTPKDLVTTLASYGTPVVLQGGGMLPVNLFLQGLVPAPVPTSLELVVVLPNGQEIPAFPPVPLSVFPFPIQLQGIWVPMPIVPAGALGKVLDFVVRFRDPVTNAVQDAAGTPFIAR